MGITNPDIKNLKTSWTKYDIVQVLYAIKSEDALEAYIKRNASINEAVLKAFIGIDDLKRPIPKFWRELQAYPKEKMIFGMMALILTHHNIIKDFAKKYASGLYDMKGTFKRCDQSSKVETNIRSALVESGTSSIEYRRSNEVPYDFSTVFQNGDLGPLFKELIFTRLIACGWSKEIIQNDIHKICGEYNFPEAFSVTSEFFKSWLDGNQAKGHYIKSVHIESFFTMENLSINFGDTKEIYFLGENGDGKTLILMALFLAFRKGYLNGQRKQDKFSSVLDFFRVHPHFEINGTDEFGGIYSTKHDSSLTSVYAYGPQRARTDSENADPYGFMTLFSNDIQLASPEAWLKHLKGKEADAMLKQRAEELIIPDRTLSRISTQTLEVILSDLLESRIKIDWDGITPIFKECGVQLTFNQLSQGYKSVIIFVVDLIYRLVHEEGELGENVLEKKSVVLVDEIDLHIHPRWQMKLVPKLKTYFPNIQFFFTTHSPTIIQAASQEALIYRVYRQDGKAFISEPYERRNLNHLMINTLATSPIFGLDDARLNPELNEYTTENTYVLYRLNKKLEQNLHKQFQEGKKFLSDSEIDQLIDQILIENDQD